MMFVAAASVSWRCFREEYGRGEVRTCAMQVKVESRKQTERRRRLKQSQCRAKARWIDTTDMRREVKI